MNPHVKRWARWPVTLLVATLLLAGLAQAQSAKPLANAREKTSYMIGMDVGGSLQPVADDIDMTALEKSVRNGLSGGEPLLQEAQAKAVGLALMQRMQARKAGNTDKLPAISRSDAGLLVGADVGRNLAPIAEEIDVPSFMRGVRVVLDKGKPLVDQTEADTLRAAFVQRQQQRAAQVGERNAADGAAFLAANKSKKGVITTRSGLQYQVIRPGSGARPMVGDKVRVNYEGTLPNGTVFDSSYQRGQPADFPLSSVIPGWREGVALMPVGAKYRFWVPGDLAYGKRGSPPNIGPNQVLVFDVELMEILK
ncbi:MAG: FKBP-type peptidyl-prolyl cis-trans isomerase [Xanthomonadaceae bacterium]|nr:FKBP-type peptidyl-prolyl cis-trans isomerase [Xanthomonadaceae bacterium]